MCLLLQRTLGAWGYEVTVAPDGPRALEAFEPERFELVLADLKMPQMDGVELTRRLRGRDPEVPIILMSAHGTIEDAVAAIKEGAADFVVKPLSMEALRLKLERTLRTRRMERENTALRAWVEGRDHFGELVGSSVPMRRVYALIERAAPTEVSVLIQGETGTGKELVARAIHLSSPRRGGPFLAVNCAALTESLLEGELFGHERGAFTGAAERRIGLIEQARGGTLFLDEIGAGSPALQARLLRAIQEREILRVGGTEPIRVDFRLVTASNVALSAEVKAGRFREDLFYRVAPLTIELPPLRERLEDLPGLAEHLIRRLCERFKRAPVPISPQALVRLATHAWPGNVRELENVLERALVVDTDGRIDEADLAIPAVAEGPAPIDAERPRLIGLLEAAGGNVAEAARRAGMRRALLYERLKRHGLDPTQFRRR
jgi:DNA-binding NtrC family response regulator